MNFNTIKLDCSCSCDYLLRDNVIAANKIFEMVDNLVEFRCYNCFDTLANVEFYNSRLFELLKYHMLYHLNENIPYNGYSYGGCSYSGVYGLDRKIICSCGYSFPVNDEVIKGQFYGMNFLEFLGQINWAYKLASNSVNIKVDKKTEREIKFPNPIMEIEL